MTPARRPRGRARTTSTVVWTDRAISDLEAIGDFIGANDSAAAERWIGVLIAAAARVAQTPMAGRCVPELGRNDVREIFKRTYRIVYRVREKRIEILTIFEGHRQFPDDVENGG